jgi:hypothetical protein
MHGIRYRKYAAGSGRNPSIFPKEVNGITVTTAIPLKVSNVRGAEARLWINGSFGVQLM